MLKDVAATFPQGSNDLEMVFLRKIKRKDYKKYKIITIVVRENLFGLRAIVSSAPASKALISLGKGALTIAVVKTCGKKALMNSNLPLNLSTLIKKSKEWEPNKNCKWPFPFFHFLQGHYVSENLQFYKTFKMFKNFLVSCIILSNPKRIQQTVMFNDSLPCAREQKIFLHPQQQKL